MPFGLSNALASFQDYVNKILAEKLNVVLIVYLDDILIYTEDPGQGHILKPFDGSLRTFGNTVFLPI